MTSSLNKHSWCSILVGIIHSNSRLLRSLKIMSRFHGRTIFTLSVFEVLQHLTATPSYEMTTFRSSLRFTFCVSGSINQFQAPVAVQTDTTIRITDKEKNESHKQYSISFLLEKTFFHQTCWRKIKKQLYKRVFQKNVGKDPRKA